MVLGPFSGFLDFMLWLSLTPSTGGASWPLWIIRSCSVYVNLASVLVFCIAIALASYMFGTWTLGGSPGSGAGAAARRRLAMKEGTICWFCNLTFLRWFTVCITTINRQSFKHRQLFNTKAKLALVCGSRISPNKVYLRTMVKRAQPQAM